MRQQFACNTDAHQALQKWLDKQEFIRIDDLKVKRHDKRTKRGRPGLNNDLSEELSMQFLLDEYKSQQAVERGFRFLKSPDFLTSSLFLKKPERIDAKPMIRNTLLMRRGPRHNMAPIKST